MTYRKKTLRKMSPVTRKLARLVGDLNSIELRLKKIISEVSDLEHDARALKNHKCIDSLVTNDLPFEELFGSEERKNLEEVI